MFNNHTNIGHEHWISDPNLNVPQQSMSGVRRTAPNIISSSRTIGHRSVCSRCLHTLPPHLILSPAGFGGALILAYYCVSYTTCLLLC
jgi:hypothetical protein